MPFRFPRIFSRAQKVLAIHRPLTPQRDFAHLATDRTVREQCPYCESKRTDLAWSGHAPRYEFKYACGRALYLLFDSTYQSHGLCSEDLARAIG